MDIAALKISKYSQALNRYLPSPPSRTLTISPSLSPIPLPSPSPPLPSPLYYNSYEPQELKDSTIATWESLLHPDDVAPAYIDLKAHLDGLTDVFQHEQRLRCKDGSYR